MTGSKRLSVQVALSLDTMEGTSAARDWLCLCGIKQYAKRSSCVGQLYGSTGIGMRMHEVTSILFTRDDASLRQKCLS